jgi:hypothetical protein
VTCGTGLRKYIYRIHLEKDENCDLLADSHNILNGGRTTFLIIECACQ